MNREKTKNVFFILCVLFFVCLASCGSGPPAGGKQLSVYLTDSSPFVLLPPSGIKKPLDMAQMVSASFEGKHFTLNSWIQADETGLDMTLFNELGANMGELSYRDGAVSFSSPVFPESMKGEYIVADFQLCFYDEIPLRRALADCGLVLECGDGFRRVLDGTTIIIEIGMNPRSFEYTNHLRRYSYTLEGDF